MGLLRKPAWPWVVVAVLLAILGLVVFDGVVAGIAYVLMASALYIAIRRALTGSDMSGVGWGGGPQGG
jgi:hypothetical protein